MTKRRLCESKQVLTDNFFSVWSLQFLIAEPVAFNLSPDMKPSRNIKSCPPSLNTFSVISTRIAIWLCGMSHNDNLNEPI